MPSDGFIEKNTRLLMMYTRLLNGENIHKAAFSVEHGISERTFDRDINSIRNFLAEDFQHDELIYSKPSDTYSLKIVRPQYISWNEALVLAKIILACGAFSLAETNALLSVVLSTVSPSDGKKVAETLAQDVKRYLPSTSSPVLKMLGDLMQSIPKGYDIELTLIYSDGYRKQIVSPLEVIYVDNAFTLVAAIDFNLKHIARIPVENIHSFTFLSSTFAQAFQERYLNNKEANEYGI